MSKAAQQAYQQGLREGYYMALQPPTRLDYPTAPKPRSAKGRKGKSVISQHVYEEDDIADDYEPMPVQRKKPASKKRGKAAPSIDQSSGGSQWMGFIPPPEY